MLDRRRFQQVLLGTAATTAWGGGGECGLQAAPRASFAPAEPEEDVFAYLQRTAGGFQLERYQQLLGAANEFKEGDESVGVAAPDEASRQIARTLLYHTKLRDIDGQPPWSDELYRYALQSRQTIDANNGEAFPSGSLTMGELKQWLLRSEPQVIRVGMKSLSSDVIGCVVKLMSNAELIAIGAKVFNPLPGSKIGAPGYLGARIQPNSPTDNVHDIRWQVFNAWSYAVGDVLLGTNPVSSAPTSVLAVERALQELLVTFDIADAMPHCVLSHIDVQAEVEASAPGSTELWFQSIAGCDTANATFDIDIAKMRRYAAARTGRYGLYFETGQGADLTNGHAHGFDMVLHESRKYGFARSLTQEVANARRMVGALDGAWVHLNDVAG
ncbi:MAG: ethanolamine ammonia-lyase subunit EutB, partial [Planctomycetales bacterium]|nr:ethanolamine ammonia-lyase subunit EutB [Planctomycetales bacterium]